MAFTVNDLQDLLKLLREHPEWREEVRREVLGEELLTIPEIVRQNSLAIDRLTERIDELGADVQALTAAVDRLVQRGDRAELSLGQMNGELLEVWYDRRPGVLAQLYDLRRVRVPELASLNLLDEAVETGVVSKEELRAVHLLDLIVYGREGTGTEAHDALLAVEVSSKIDMYDVRRAEERADILRKAGYTAYPVVAGHEVDELTERYLRERGIRYHLRPGEQAAAS